MRNENTITAFADLLNLADHLLSPEGCAWDREQNFTTLRDGLLEEAAEVIEAIDENNQDHIIEELGDLLYQVVFLCKVAEKEKRFHTSEIITRIRKKLIGRHPHVFGGNKLHDSQEILDQWEKIKQTEKTDRKSTMDGIPKKLPALARGYKVAHKMRKNGFEDRTRESLFNSEEELALLLWAIVQHAEKKRLNPELTLRREILHREKIFRQREKLQRRKTFKN